ncbi:hypothetical protein C8R43DRAFT_949408 [Mycena crocata]|nr:hypothetical protein C8R43DRAFT_949408 [Mycena crocata]
MCPPPLKSKHQSGPTAYEMKMQRLLERREKACVRMARKRTELKSRPLEEQEQAAEREHMYQATYHERHAHIDSGILLFPNALHTGITLTYATGRPSDVPKHDSELQCRLYQERHGPETYTAYAKCQRHRRRRAREKKRAKEGYYDDPSQSAPAHVFPSAPAPSHRD